MHANFPFPEIGLTESMAARLQVYLTLLRDNQWKIQTAERAGKLDSLEADLLALSHSVNQTGTSTLVEDK